MALTDKHIAKIDELRAAGKKKPDIVDELIKSHGASSRDVDTYLASNKTIQGTLKYITQNAPKLIAEGEQAKRKELVDAIVKHAKEAINMLKA